MKAIVPVWARCRNVNWNDLVYFVRGADLIKIGTTTGPMWRRLSSLQCSSPVPLQLLLIISGGREIEWHLHQQHRALRVHGEWFRAEPSLIAHIARLQARRTKTVQALQAVGI